MHCELLDKDVQIEVWKEIKDAKDDILKTVYKCSECYPEIAGTNGRKAFQYCAKMGDKNCLLKRYTD
jgi:hypothetical protein